MNLRTVRAIAAAEWRRDEHRYGATRRQRALLVVGAAVFLPLVALLLRSAYGVGRSVAAGEADALVDVLRWYLPGSVALFVVVGGLGAGRRLLRFEAKPLLLTTVPTRDLAYGLLLADLRSVTLSLVGPTVLVVAAFALGAGSPLALVVGTAAAAVLAVASVAVGYAVGMAGRVLLAAVPLTAGQRSVLGTVGTVGGALLGGAAGAYVGATAGDVGVPDLGSLVPEGPPPVVLGYYADLLFVGTPAARGIGPATLASAAVFAAAIPLSVAAVARLSARLWYTDPRRPEESADGADASGTATVGDRRAWPWLGTRTGVVADGILRRALRTPGKQAHLGYYAIVLGVVAVAGVIGAPEAAGWVVGFGLAVLGVWLAGGAVGLNPLGEEGSMLGQLVLSTTPARTFVRARVLAGVAVGLVPVALGTALLAVSGLAPGDALAAGAVWAVLTVVSAAAAVGVGTLLPRTEPGSVLDAAETVPPETVALVAHAVATLALWAGATVLILATPGGTVALAGGAVLALSAAVLADGGYRFAVRGLSDYGRPARRDPLLAVEVAVGLAVLGAVLSTTVGLGAILFVPVTDGLLGFVLAFLAGYAGYALVVVAYALVSGRGWSLVPARRPSGADLRALAVGLVASLGVYAALVAGVALLEVPVSQHAIAGEIAGGGPAFAAALVVLALLVNGPVEELLFRGVIQDRLAAAMDERLAVAVAAVVFALAHLPVYFAGGVAAVAVTTTTLAVLGGIWGWVYARTDNVVVPALCHGLYNAALFGVAYVSLF